MHVVTVKTHSSLGFAEPLASGTCDRGIPPRVRQKHRSPLWASASCAGMRDTGAAPL